MFKNTICQMQTKEKIFCESLEVLQKSQLAQNEGIGLVV